MKIGIALGGGGARGFAHIGVLKVLTEAGIDCQIISGTSIGALVGAVYASDKLDILEQEVRKLKLHDLPMLLSPTWSRSGFFSGKNALEKLMNIIGAHTIEELPKPFASISVDLQKSEIIPATKGNLRKAIRASIAIPGVFTPVTNKTQILVDGGTLDPVPVEINRTLGGDFIIAVDLFGETYCSHKEQQTKQDLWPTEIVSALNYFRSFGSKIWSLEDDHSRNNPINTNLITVIERTLAIAQRAMTSARLSHHPPEFIIRPSVSHVGLLDFHRAQPVIKIGENAAKAILPDIKAKLEAAYAADSGQIINENNTGNQLSTKD